MNILGLMEVLNSKTRKRGRHVGIRDTINQVAAVAGNFKSAVSNLDNRALNVRIFISNCSANVNVKNKARCKIGSCDQLEITGTYRAVLRVSE